MSKYCSICQKTSMLGGKRHLLRAHYNQTQTKRQRPNIQSVRLPDGKRVKACTHCIKGVLAAK